MKSICANGIKLGNCIPVIQRSFRAALAQEIQRIVNNPGSIMDLLASSLPAQSTYFVQLSFVYTVTTFLTEGLGPTRIALGIARSFIGPNLTDRERKKPLLVLRAISEPNDFEYGNNMSLLVGALVPHS